MGFDHRDCDIPSIRIGAQRAALRIWSRHRTALRDPDSASFALLLAQFLSRLLQLDLRFGSGFKVNHLQFELSQLQLLALLIENGALVQARLFKSQELGEKLLLSSR